MYFSIFRDFSVKIGIYKKAWDALRKMPVLSVSGRHDDDRRRNTPAVFRKASDAFYNFRSLPIFTDFLRRLPNCITKLKHHSSSSDLVAFRPHCNGFTRTEALKYSRFSISRTRIFRILRNSKRLSESKIHFDCFLQP